MSENIKFIRVQQDLNGTSIDKDNIVTIPYDNSNYNNTIHFSINSIFHGSNNHQKNHNEDGDFIGQFAIISSPENMPIPSGLTQGDTWFRVGDVPIAEDTAIMGIKITNPVLVAPEGTSLPKEMNVLFHKGTLESRNEVISNYLKSQNITCHNLVENKWEDYQDNSQEWAKSISHSIYGKEAYKISNENFTDSLDGKIKSNLETIKEKTENFKNKPLDNYYTYINGEPNKTSVYLNNLIAQTKEQFQYIYENSTVDENVRIRLQYVDYTKEIDKYRRIVNRTEESIQIDKASASSEQLEKLISSLDGKGKFEVIEDGKAVSVKLTAKEIINQITLGLISSNASVVRTGMDSPQSLSIHKEHIETIAQFKDRAILKKMAELKGTDVFIVKDGNNSIQESLNLEIYNGLKNGSIQAEATIQRKGFNINNAYSIKDIYDGKASKIVPVQNISHNFNFKSLANKVETMEQKEQERLKNNNNNNSNDLGM